MVGITEKQADRDCCGFGTGCSVAAAMPLEAPWRCGVVLWRRGAGLCQGESGSGASLGALRSRV